jgi:glutaconate CoA-transferase, subunit A
MSAARTKLVEMDEAIGVIKDGMSLTAGGFAHSHQPMALTRAIIRRGVRNLTIMGVAECWVAEYLAAAGAIEQAYMSNFMFEGFGRCRRFSEAVETGEIATEDHSHFGMICRLQAAGLGLPFMPIRAMSGTDIIERPGFEDAAAKSRRIESPFGGEAVRVVSPLKPDVAIIHAARADLDGNVQLFGATSVLEEQARAASHVIVSVEEIVSADVIRRQPELTILPGLLVDALVHLPYGAHPTGVYGYYDHDAAHLGEYYQASRDREATDGYLRRWVFEMEDHWSYLDAIGMSSLLRLRVDPALGSKLAARPS